MFLIGQGQHISFFKVYHIATKKCKMSFVLGIFFFGRIIFIEQAVENVLFHHVIFVV